MKILEEAGLVRRRRQGTWILYSLTDSSDSVYTEAMLMQLSAWLNDDPQVQQMLAALPDAAALRTSKQKNN